MVEVEAEVLVSPSVSPSVSLVWEAVGSASRLAWSLAALGAAVAADEVRFEAALRDEWAGVPAADSLQAAAFAAEVVRLGDLVVAPALWPADGFRAAAELTGDLEFRSCVDSPLGGSVE